MLRRTKIVATLGPATDAPQVLEQMLLAGVNVVRLNFSHGDAEEHQARARMVREISARHNLNVAILADLQGPKIRVRSFRDGKVTLQRGAPFALDATLDEFEGDIHQVGIDYPALPADCRPGDILLLDDGRIELRVDSITTHRIDTEVLVGGPLSNHKGINRQGGGLSAPALSDKDEADIVTAAAIGVDFVAVSFVRSAEDIDTARQLIREAGSQAAVVAKIERAEAVASDAALDRIITAADVIMVARGDLGVEVGDWELVGIQKQIIKRAWTLNRVVITATQMMESMIDNPVPTRAEVFDVANAVLDGTDAVMLSAETATGHHPVEAVRAMARTCIGAEKQPSARSSSYRVDSEFHRIDEAIAMASMYIANHLTGIKAVVCLTESGATPLWMSRISSAQPIYALSRHHSTLRRVALYRDVEGLLYDYTQVEPDEVNKGAIDLLEQQGAVQKGDLVIITEGDHRGKPGATNTLRILQVGTTFKGTYRPN